MPLVLKSWRYMESNLRPLNLCKVGYLKYSPETQPPLASQPCPLDHASMGKTPESALTLLTAFWNSSVSQG